MLAAVDDLALALRHALRCPDHEGITVVCDSVLNRWHRVDSGLLIPDLDMQVLTPADLEQVFADAPQSIRDCLSR